MCQAGRGPARTSPVPSLGHQERKAESKETSSGPIAALEWSGVPPPGARLPASSLQHLDPTSTSRPGLCTLNGKDKKESKNERKWSRSRERSLCRDRAPAGQGRPCPHTTREPRHDSPALTPALGSGTRACPRLGSFSRNDRSCPRPYCQPTSIPWAPAVCRVCVQDPQGQQGRSPIHEALQRGPQPQMSQEDSPARSTMLRTRHLGFGPSAFLKDKPNN